jgi:hypothetical protein
METRARDFVAAIAFLGLLLGAMGLAGWIEGL